MCIYHLETSKGIKITLKNKLVFHAAFGLF